MLPFLRLSRGSSGPTLLILLMVVGMFSGQAAAYENIMKLSRSCVLAIIDIMSDYKFEGIGGGSTYPTLCKNPVAALSFYATAELYCTPRQYKSGLKLMEGRCIEYTKGEMMPRSVLAANLTPEAVAALPVYGMKELSPKKNLTEAWVPDEDWYKKSYKTLYTFWHVLNIHHIYSWALYGFWGPILIFGMVHKLYRVTLDKSRGYVYLSDVETGASGPSQGVPTIFKPIVAVIAVMRKYALVPSALPPYHQRRFFGCTIPTRWESFVVLSFWILNIILCAVTIIAFDGNTMYNSVPKQVWKYVSDRTANLSYANLPLIWMFAGRNNIFLWLTGWSFGTFNIYHKHIARIATIQAIVHSIGYTEMAIKNGGEKAYKARFKMWWWTAGVLATLFMSLICFFSFHFMRRKFYESFLLIHIVFSVLTLAFLYYHTEIFDLGEYNYPYLIPPIAIWAFDRVARMVRQLYCNLYVNHNRGKGLISTKSTITYDDETNIITVDMIPGNSHLFCGPGQFYYIYQPFRFFGWENHPFTVGNWYHDERDGEFHLVFWIRPYNGWTKHLQVFTQKNGQGDAVNTKLLLEGPYGHTEALHCFENILLVAGGSGVACVLPYLVDHIRRTEKAKEQQDGNSQKRIPTRTRHITLIWSDRSQKFIQEFYDKVLAPIVAGRDDITLMLHLTRPPPAAPSGTVTNSSSDTVDGNHLDHSKIHSHTEGESSSEEVASPTTTLGGPQLLEKSASSSDHELHGHHDHDPEKEATSSTAVQKCPFLSKARKQKGRACDIQYGRPDVLKIVREMAVETKNSQQRLAVMASGPGSLSDDIRHEVAHQMETFRDSIEYFEDSFGW